MSEEMVIPIFKSDEEEAEFWDEHSPLDFGEPKPESIVALLPKDSMLCVRLDSRTYSQLTRLGKRLGIKRSTLARLIITSAVKYSLRNERR